MNSIFNSAQLKLKPGKIKMRNLTVKINRTLVCKENLLRYYDLCFESEIYFLSFLGNFEIKIYETSGRPI